MKPSLNFPPLAALVLFGATTLIRSEPQPFPAREDHWLAFDTRAFESGTVEGLELVHGSVRKHPGNPLLPADKPWEEATNNLYPNIVYDDQTKQYRLFYKCVIENKELIARMQPPRTTHEVGWYLLHATSTDGLKWEKPLHDQHAFTDAGFTNAVARDCPNAGVFLDPNPAAPVSRRYKMVFDRGAGNFFVAFSADGIRWDEPLPVKIQGHPVGDTHNNAFWDERLGKYVLITRHYLGERTVARSESSDFVTWEPSVMVLRPTIEEGTTHQIYNLSVFRYGNAYVGLLMNYHLGAGRTVDCELAWSPDSLQWHRLLPGHAFIPLGAPGSYDSKCIYAQANPPLLDQEGNLMIYYGGDDFEHRGWVRSCLLSLATVRRDGFAGWHPTGGGKGKVTTAPLMLGGDAILVSADVDDQGRIRAEVLDSDGGAIEGFTADECVPLTQTATDGVLRWQGADPARLRGKIIRLRFTIEGDATLYSMAGLVDPGRPRISPTGRPFSGELSVTIAPPAPAKSKGIMRYTLDGSTPQESAELVPESPIILTESATVTSRFFLEGHTAGSAIVKETFTRRVPWSGLREVVRHSETFDTGLNGWKAYEEAVHVPQGGVRGGGYVRAERAKGGNPYLSSYATASGGVFAGDLERRYGGVGIDVSFSVRAKGAREGLLGIYAEELANWAYMKLPKATEDWTRVRVGFRYDWSDEEARAAGWEPTADAFSWRETVAHAGRIVFGSIVNQPGSEVWSYDIDEVTFSTLFEDPEPAGNLEE